MPLVTEYFSYSNQNGNFTTTENEHSQLSYCRMGLAAGMDQDGSLEHHRRVVQRGVKNVGRVGVRLARYAINPMQPS